MSEIGHNGSSEGASILPPDPHDEFQELCALSTTGELTPEEWVRMEQHLSQCASCRQAQQEFERLVALTIPALAEEDGVNVSHGISPESWSIGDAEAELMESLRDEPSPVNAAPSTMLIAANSSSACTATPPNFGKYFAIHSSTSVAGVIG